jgi:hypothetical protein
MEPAADMWKLEMCTKCYLENCNASGDLEDVGIDRVVVISSLFLRCELDKLAEDSGGGLL